MVGSWPHPPRTAATDSHHLLSSLKGLPCYLDCEPRHSLRLVAGNVAWIILSIPKGETAILILTENIEEE
jgi:hypothetical protein